MSDAVPYSKADERFAKAVRSSGLVPSAELNRTLEIQAEAARRGRKLPLDRILLKLQLLDRAQIMGLWRALRYYLWRKEDKFYVKLAVQSAVLTGGVASACLREQKRCYKYEDQLVRVNQIARSRGYLDAEEDRALVEAMHKIKPFTLKPAGQVPAQFERPSKGAARVGEEKEWLQEARRQDLGELRVEHAKLFSESGHGVSDEDLDALWEEADLDDVELDSQAIEIARSPLLDDSEDEFDSEDDLFR